MERTQDRSETGGTRDGMGHARIGMTQTFKARWWEEEWGGGGQADYPRDVSMQWKSTSVSHCMEDPKVIYLNGRGERIRTSDPLVPKRKRMF